MDSNSNAASPDGPRARAGTASDTFEVVADIGGGFDHARRDDRMPSAIFDMEAEWRPGPGADNYLYGRPDLDDTIRRLTAFEEVGADVLCAPLLPSMNAIRAVVKAVSPKPVNILIGPGDGPVPIAELQAAGVKRICLGATLYCHVMKGLKEVAEVMAAGNISPAADGLPPSTITGLIKRAAGPAWAFHPRAFKARATSRGAKSGGQLGIRRPKLVLVGTGRPGRERMTTGSEFLRFFPFLHHIAGAEAWPSILEHGLESS